MESISTLLADKERFVLTTHVNPDGDGLGSEVALAAWLTQRGKTAAIINHSVTPAVYDFLDPENRIRVFHAERDARTIAEADVIIVLDTNHPSRLRSMESYVLQSPAIKACIDHHLEPSPFADVFFLDEDATSTGEMLFRLLHDIDPSPLSPIVSEALYCAIMTDTGSFRYPRVDAETHRMVAALIEGGADPVAIYSKVYDRWSLGRVRLLGEMLAQMETSAEGRVACVSITQEMLHRTGSTEEDTDTFTTFVMSIAGVVVGILLLELTDGVKASFRSRGEIPINELAKEFGGNGHKNAAGARLDRMSLPHARALILHAVQKYATLER